MGTDLTVKDLLAILDKFAAFGLAEKWDNVGLMVGSQEQKVHGILVALDPSEEILAEAEECSANCILTHHPLIFNPLKSIYTDQPLGRVLQGALQNNITVIGCHTNLDQTAGGVNDVLAAGLGLVDLQPLAPVETDAADQDVDIGFGRIGRLAEPLSSETFIKRLCDFFQLPCLRVAGQLPETITTVAVCGGSGSELAEKAKGAGVQVYITGEVKHSTARWAEAAGFCLIDAGHFPTENPVVEALVKTLQELFSVQGITVPVRPTTRQRNPFVYRQPEG
jgi:dinuclear metal center YbgI/SA1388 family protein